MLPPIPRTVLYVALGFVLLFGFLIVKMRQVEGRTAGGVGKFFDGRLIGVVGLPGFGKTSFVMHAYVLPALRSGRTVVTNFTVKDDDMPGRAVKMKPDTFGADLLGIGSSLNVDDEGQPMSGWFIDTACTCGKEGRDQLACACNGVVLVIDESHAFMPASNTRPLPIDLLTWLTMCRKNHLQIIWCTQYYKWVHSAVRRLTADVYQCSRNGLQAHHVARLHALDGNGNLSADATSEIKYDVRKVGDRYDTYEVIIPAASAYQIAGELRKRNVGEPRPALRVVNE